MPIVAFPGIKGAHAENAAYHFFGGETPTMACFAPEGVFDAVERGLAQVGMLPVENALSGSQPHAYELLMERDLRIQAEVILRVQHTLMAAPGVKLEDLRRIRSDRQSLSQCEAFINRHQLAQEPAFDTATSARDLAQKPEADLGVIASKLAAEVYHLDILAETIDETPFNYTRYFVLGAEDSPRAQRSKTSLIFSTRHLPGSLYQCLGEFAERNLNLTKIESRPRRDKPWQYLFYLDFEGFCQDPAAEAALLGLMRRAGFVKLLGSYPMATMPHPDGITQPQTEGSLEGDSPE
jgi:prephenate dehydratase